MEEVSVIRVLASTNTTHGSSLSSFYALLFYSVRNTFSPSVLVKLAQIHVEVGGVRSRKNLIPSLRWLCVWVQHSSVCPGGHCQEASCDGALKADSG